MKIWELDDARTRFADLARRALGHRPQRVKVGEREEVIIVSAADYAALTFAGDLVDFVRRTASADRNAQVRLQRAQAAALEGTQRVEDV